MPSLLFCSPALQQIKSYSGLFPFSGGLETGAEPASPGRYLLQGDDDAAGGNRFLPDKTEDKYSSNLLSLDWNDTSLHLSPVYGLQSQLIILDLCLTLYSLPKIKVE